MRLNNILFPFRGPKAVAVVSTDVFVFSLVGQIPVLGEVTIIHASGDFSQVVASSEGTKRLLLSRLATMRAAGGLVFVRFGCGSDSKLFS